MIFARILKELVLLSLNLDLEVSSAASYLTRLNPHSFSSSCAL
jgi:hypothetical protein